ncbi:MAG TPA: hypothetical protein GXZ20_05560 [Halanaerobiaceae bacterium]|jgi:hypothetical protein|nr:hypothetical protein [Bacillota bacterium]HHU92585.1 hypothetical protein [Halanaerobiaceae bacterium]
MYKRFLGIFLMGLVIKMMDDYIDKEIDLLKGQWNLSLIFKNAILPYALLLLIFSLYFNFSEAVTIFAASYFLGMASELKETLPSGLMAWQEGIILLILITYITSVQESLAAILIVITIQLIDDFLDLKKDKYIDNRNLVNKLGKFNASLITLALMLISLKYFLEKSLYCYSALICLYILLYLIEKKYGKDESVNKYNTFAYHNNNYQL